MLFCFRMSCTKDLYEFLVEAELPHYYQSLKEDLRVTKVSMLKYVVEEEMCEMGMTKPEIRRLKKFYRKEYPQGTIGKIRRVCGNKETMGRSGGYVEI